MLVVNALLQAFNNKTAIEFIASLVEPLQEEPCSSSQVKAPPKRKAAANRQPEKKATHVAFGNQKSLIQ